MSDNNQALEFIKSLLQEKMEKQIAEYISQGITDDEIIKKLISQYDKGR